MGLKFVEDYLPAVPGGIDGYPSASIEANRSLKC
jgi:hypothetical protein